MYPNRLFSNRIISSAVLLLTIGISTLSGILLLGCKAEKDDMYSIGVFIPGHVEGSPTYEMTVAGARAAASERQDAEVTVVEAGTNQAQWKESLMSMAAKGNHELIVSSNPALPDIARQVAEQVPEQKFLLLDTDQIEHPAIAAVRFHHGEQAYLNGYFAALISESELPRSSPEVKLGLIAGQEYPLMKEVIRKGFLKGAQAVNPDAELDFRVVGSWNDPTKAAELTRSVIAGGSDVILTICGGGNQGVVTSADEEGAYVTWFDAPGYDHAPGTVLGSTVVAQDRVARERVLDAIDGNLQFGTTELIGVAEGYVGFADEHPVYRQTVPEQIRRDITAVENELRTGEKEIPIRFE